MRSEVEFVGLEGIDGEALARLLAVKEVIAAHLEGQIDALERVAAIGGDQDRRVDGRP